MSRPSWDEFFLNIAGQMATRATCDRKHVGAVIVDGKFIISTGYNGSGSGEPHCDDAGHLMVRGEDGKDHCRRTMHAERNAIWQAQLRRTGLTGTTLYTTASPCMECAVRIVEVGIKRVVYREFYRDDPSLDYLRQNGVSLMLFAVPNGQ